MGHRLRGSIKYTYSQTFEIEDTDPTSESLKPLVGMKSETEVGGQEHWTLPLTGTHVVAVVGCGCH